MKKITRTLILALTVVGLAACEEENVTPTTDPSNGAYALVLNEGGNGANNTSISRLELGSGNIDNNWFSNANGRGLGDLGQDMIAYGSKVYAVVSNSNSVEVIKPESGLSTRIDMGDRMPRYIAASGSKLYVSCYNPHSVVRIDTATCEIEATWSLTRGFNPEGIAVAQGKIFVVSSWTADESYNYSYDSVAYVIDENNATVPTAITVGCNPQKIVKIDDNRLLVCYSGDYGGRPAGSAIIDATTLTVSQTNQELAGADVYNGTVYGYASTWTEGSDGSWSQSIGYFTLDPATMTSAPMLESCGITNPYGIAVNPDNGDIYILSGDYGVKGDVNCFTQSGTLRFKSEAGYYPKVALFFN